MDDSTPYLTLTEARAAIDREIAKRRDERRTAAIVVVDAGGNVVSASRMDDAPLAAIGTAREAARDIAVEGTPGNAAIVKGGRVVGGIASDGMHLTPEETGPPLPLGLIEARRYADRAIAEANQVGSPVGVAIVDELGRLIQVDRMDASPLVSCDMAEAKAMTALKFRRPTTTLTEEFRGNSARLRAIENLVGFTLLAMGGGVPIEKDGRLVGAIGVSGSGGGPRRDEAHRINDNDIAKAALEG